MNTFLKWGAIVLGVIIAVSGISSLLGGPSLSAVINDRVDLVGDVYQGRNGTLIFRDGVFQGAPIATSSAVSITGPLTVTGTSTLATTSAAGVVTLSGGAIFSGANTISGTTTASGGFTFSSYVVVEKSASSTLQVGNSGAGVGPGCFIVGDSGGATSTPVYITATGATLTATTTKPAICATAQ